MSEEFHAKMQELITTKQSEIKVLLPEDKVDAYDAIIATFTEEREAFRAERQTVVEENLTAVAAKVVEQTTTMLTTLEERIG